ncbi:mannose-6-phosphate isomerase, class I [bacterium]
MDKRPFLLDNQIQNYTWGAKNQDAFIPHLLGIPIIPDLPYAELWMGAHPKAPSMVQLNQKKISLADTVLKYPFEILGNTSLQNHGKIFPFLFKVLSASQALSIQVHPNKKQAIDLHKKDPEHYPDGNYKPEIAIALDKLTALVGFRPIQQIHSTINEIPEILSLINSQVDQQDNLPSLFNALMSQSHINKSALENAIITLERRLQQKNSKLTKHEILFLELRKIYHGPDIGLLALFFLNLIQLNPGQGIFLDAGIPHAYIQGNIIECMANSDNVVRAGLTSKFKDIETLTRIVHYNDTPIPIIDPNTELSSFSYPVPVSEFHVTQIQLKKQETLKQNTFDKPTILLCVEGEYQFLWRNEKSAQHTIYQKGQAILIPAFLMEYELTAFQDSQLFVATTQK